MASSDRKREDATTRPGGFGANRPDNRPRGGFGRGGPGMGMGAPIERPKDTIATLRKLWAYLVEEKSALAGVFVLVVASSLATLVGPFLIGVAIDRFIIPGDFAGLAWLAFAMLVVNGLGAGAIYAQHYLMLGVAQQIVMKLRRNLFAKLQRLPLRFFDQKTHGELMSRLTNDIENINNTLNNGAVEVFSSFILLLGTILMMLVLSPALTLVSLLIIPMMAVVTKFVAQRTRKYFAELQENLGDINGFIEETVSGQRVVKVFCREAAVMRGFDERNERLRNAGLRAQIFAGTMGPLMNAMNNLSFAALAAVGGWLVVQGMITVGVIAAFLNYSRQFTRPLTQMANQFNQVQSAIAGAERCFQVMEEEPEEPDAPGAVSLTHVAGEVRFEDVTFAYKSGEPVLRNVNLTVTPGQTIALVGPTGAGKTTIISILSRFYEIEQGKITIDGHDIRYIARDNLRSLLGTVLQDTYLFSETVRENIRYGRLDATDEEVEVAAQLANADAFIRQLSHGYDTVLSEDGGDLSQGQRQLLAIARAILADPAILILDEATSSVDTRTEVQIQQAMLHLMQGRTCFVIAHRLSTIRGADQIVVIDHGAIIEQGTHQELLDKKGFYHNLYMAQFERQAS